MTEKPHRMSHREAVERVRAAESFALKLPIVGLVPLANRVLAFVGGFVGLTLILLLVGQLLSGFLVIRGMFDAERVMAYSSPILYLVIAAVATVSAVLGFQLLVKLMTGMARDVANVHIVWAVVVAVIGISVASSSLSFAVQLIVLLAHESHAIALQPAQSELTIKDLYGKAVYEILDAIPILKIPATIGWRDPIPRPALSGGIVLILLKFLLVAWLARLFSQLWVAARAMRRNMRAGRPDAFNPQPGRHRSDVGDSVQTSPDTETGEPTPDKQGTHPSGPGQVP